MKSLSTRHGPETPPCWSHKVLHQPNLGPCSSTQGCPWQSRDCSKTRPMVPVPGSSRPSHEAQRFLRPDPLPWCTHGVFGTDIMDLKLPYFQVKSFTSYPPLTCQDPTQQVAMDAHTLQAAWSWNQPRVLAHDPHGAPVVSDGSLRPEIVAVASAIVNKSYAECSSK